MTETPEQRRERIEEALWTVLRDDPCEEPCWTYSTPMRQGCDCLVRLAEAFLVIDKETSNGNG